MMEIAKQSETPRFSGILAHPSSFPSPYGIGDFGPGAYEFIDYLEKAGQTLWQILPLGPTGFGDSPYQSFSAFAGQTLFISPDLLVEDHLLSEADLCHVPCFDPEKVDYGAVLVYKKRLFETAYENFKSSKDKELKKDYDRFCQENQEWLFDYALFMAIKDSCGGCCWLEWEDSMRDPSLALKKKWAAEHSEAVGYHTFLQFLFLRQWTRLKKYANDRNIRIIGDIPIFVSPDSVDV